MERTYYYYVKNWLALNTRYKKKKLLAALFVLEIAAFWG
jgi:hypothetical protein